MSIVTKENNYMVLALEGESHGFPNLLREKLMEDSGVEFVSYRIDHPQLGFPRIHVRTKGKKPEKALTDALKRVRKDIDVFKKAVGKKATKTSKKTKKKK